MRRISIVKSSTGAAAVEFAISLPILVVILVGIWDYGKAVNIGTKLYNAARAGAQYAIYHPADRAGIVSTAQNATSDSGMTVTVATPPYVCSCSDSSTTFACNPKAVQCSGATVYRYVTVSTSQSYSPFISYGGIGANATLTGSATIEVP